ncbi:MAG: hypothetical protein ACRBCT_00445 [Alphaproteobacteria bacterium]
MSSHFNSVRVACFGAFIVFGVLSLCTVSLGHAKDASLPYKAKTVDECIHEKECVW